MSRFKYVEYAYGDMAKWMQQGTEEEKKLKRYIHRYLDIPKSCLHPPEKKDDAKEILMEFGYHYTTALLNYCSDHLKDGMFAILTLSHSLTQSHTSYTLSHAHAQGITSCPSARRNSSRNSQWGRCAWYTSTPWTSSSVVKKIAKRTVTNVTCQRSCSPKKSRAGSHRVRVP